MNEESLRLAETELGKVQKLFGTILLFWEEFSAKLSALTKSHDGVKLLLDFIDDSDLQSEIDEEMGHVKMVSFYYLSIYH